MSSCKLEYNGRIFNSEAELLDHVQVSDVMEGSPTLPSTASPDTIKKVNNFLSRIGVDVKKMAEIKVNGKRLGVNGLADPVQNLIQVIEDKEDVALTEEAAHMAVELLEQQGSPLFDQMLKQIDRYQLFRDVMSEYRDVHKGPDGKPDIRKIKKEAMAKLMVEHIIALNEGVTEKPELMVKAQSWWKSVLEFLQGLFSKAPNPFREVSAQVLNTNALSDLQFQLSSTLQKADAALDQKMIEFLKPLGITVEMLEDLKARTGVDAVGAADIINKIILVAKGKADISTLPEETAHFFVELMGNQHPTVKALMSKITEWDGYQAVKDEYLSQYGGNEAKVKKEAIGKLIAQHIVSKANAPKSLLQEIKDFIKEALKIFDINWINVEDIAQDIAIDILNKDYSKIKQKLPTGSRLVDYENSFNKAPYIREVADKIRKLGFYLTGSTALRKQGTVYRSNDENIHDLDFKVPLSMLKTWRQILEKEFGPLKEEYSFSRKNEDIVSFNINGVSIDFFVNPETKFQSTGDNLVSWQSIFGAKLGLDSDLFGTFGRVKDVTDFMVFTPNQKSLGFDNSDYVYYQLSSDPVAKMFGSVMEVHDRMALVDGKYQIDGKDIKNRVSDKVKAYFAKLYPSDKKKADKEAAFEQMASKGTDIHADLEDIFGRYIDRTTGLRRDNPLPQQSVSHINPTNNGFYQYLEKYFVETLDQKNGSGQPMYPEGTRFLSEVKIFDARKDQGGTIDFLALIPTPDGGVKVDIKDWKSMSIGKDKDDIPFYKKEAFNIQISEYKDTLVKSYGFKPDQFRQTRAIPIVTSFKQKAKDDPKLELAGIVVGNADPSKITDLRLLPVATKDEKTGNKEIDKIIDSLNKLYKILRDRPIEEGRRDQKNERLNQLEKAIRTLQIQGKAEELAKSAASIILSTQRHITRAMELYKAGNLTEEARKEVMNEIFEQADTLDFYISLDASFDGIDLNEKTKADLDRIAGEALKVKRELNKLVEQVGSELALGYGIKDITDPEKKIGWTGKYFSAFSEAKTKAVAVFRKIWNEVTGSITMEQKERFDKIVAMRNAIQELAKKKGVKVEDLLKMLMGKNKEGQWNGELIRKVKKEAYDLLKKHQETILTAEDSKEAVAWIKENINLEEYAKWYEQALKDKIAFEEQNVYHFDDIEADIAERKKRIEAFKATYDVTRNSAFSMKNYKLRQYLKEENWLSDEYLAIQKEQPLLEFYEYWQERMKHAYDLGMIKEVAWSRFVPNVRKNLIERLYHGVSTRDKSKRLQTDWFASLAPDVENTTTTLTGEIRHNITAAFVQDLAEWREKSDGSRYADYSQKSDDLFKVLNLFEEEILKYQHRTNIEHDVRILHMLEQNKTAYTVDRKSGERHPVGNEDNAKYFENFMNYYVYNVKYEDNSMDATYKLPINKYIKNVNKVFKAIGVGEIIPYNEKEEVTISVRKQIEGLNRFFQLKTLTANVPTAITNFVGGKMNSLIQSGREFNKKDLFAAEALMRSNKFNSKEGNKIAGLLDYFFPFLDTEKRIKYNRLSVKGAAANMSSDWLMYLQRKSDTYVKVPVQIAYLMNTMIEDGKLVNINDYIREKSGYDGIFRLAPAEREAKLKEIEKEVAELKKTRSLIQVAEVVDDKIVLPNLDKKSHIAFVHRVDTFTKDVLGNMDESDRYQYRMNIIFNSVMMFKNWIPRMVKVRYGGLTYNIDKDNWEIGRWRLMWNGVMSNLTNASMNAMGIIQGKENLIQKALSEYNKYRGKAIDSGQEFMTESEFVEMYIKYAHEAVKEVMFLLALAGFLAFAASNVPDTDDKEEKSRYRWGQRLLDKTYDELAFFFSPTSLVQVANGSVFPALGMLSDIAKFSKNLTLEAYYAATGDEDNLEKNKVLKYAFKVFPITKELATYISLFNADFAKDYGIHIQSNYQAR